MIGAMKNRDKCMFENLGGGPFFLLLRKRGSHTGAVEKLLVCLSEERSDEESSKKRFYLRFLASLGITDRPNHAFFNSLHRVAPTNMKFDCVFLEVTMHNAL